MQRLFSLSIIIAGIVGNIFIQISPKDAVTNFSLWITSLFGSSPDWLIEKNTDTIVYYLSNALISVGIVWFFWPYFIRIYKWMWPPLKAKLSLFHDTHPQIKHWRVTVRNRSNTVVENVKMRLLSITPHPRYSMWPADYPYTVKPININLSELSISSRSKEPFEVMVSWPNKDGEIFITGLDTKSSQENKIKIELDERWKLKYEITSNNNASMTLALEAFVQNGSLVVQKR